MNEEVRKNVNYGTHKELDISNLVNTKVAKFIKYQPNRKYNHLLSLENASKVNLKGISLIEVF